MIGIGLTLEIRQTLALVGGATESIFTGAESLLLSSGRVQEALQYVARRKSMDRYRSTMDFLLCELFPEHQPGCWRFYAGKGPQLKKLLTAEEVLVFDGRLIAVLVHALAISREHDLGLRKPGRVSWGTLRKEVRDFGLVA